MVVTKKIAVLCNYALLPERVGGMDYFFWMFDEKCKANGIAIDWFFPNVSSHGNYSMLTIFSSDGEEVETYFERNHATGKYSHIITHFIELCTSFFQRIKKKGNAKIIAIDHNPRPIQGYSLKKKIEKKAKGLLFSKYIDVFVAVSGYSKKHLIAEFGPSVKNKIQIIYNGIDSEKYLKKTDFTFHGKFIVACHLRKDKGIQDLLTALNEIQKTQPIDFSIDIYGEGDYQTILENMLQRFSLKKAVSFKGSVSNLHEIYSRYDYLIHPSHGETFCYSVVESLMSNLPVITTRNQGNVLGLVNEGRNGFLFDEENSVQLKIILLKIVNNEKSIGNFLDADSEISKLTLENMVANHFTLLQ